MKETDINDLPVYDSSQQRSMALSELLDAYKYRNAIFQLTRRDVVSRYKRSFLGIIWTMLNPLGMMLIMAVVFSTIFNAGPTYAAYVLSGLIVWNFFSQTTNAIIKGLNAGMGLIRKIYVPQSIFGISAILTGLVNVLFALVPLFFVMLLTGVHFTWAILFTPVSILLLALFSLGVGMIVATLGVFFPDVIEMYQIVLIAWMYLTPVIYPISILPETTRFLITHFNPMFAFVQIFRVVTYDGRLPLMEEILPALIFSLLSIVVGWWFFSRKAGDFAYRV